MIYVHEAYLEKKIEENSRILRRGPRAGQMVNGALANAYEDFKTNKYLPMREAILAMTFDVEQVESFSDCAEILNGYYSDLMQFMQENGIGKKSKIHTDFLEEFSIYFLSGLIPFDVLDVFNKKIFSGMKINPDHTIKQITKDVDFCVGKILDVQILNEDIIIPAISVEVKTYIDATMLGEVMNTSRKIKGANPGSKSMAITWSREFADEHLLEAAYDGSIDEIIELGTKKRTESDSDVIEFTREGLRDYYAVFSKYMDDVMEEPEFSQVGRLLSEVRHAF